MRYCLVTLLLATTSFSSFAEGDKSAPAPGWWPGKAGLYVCERQDIIHNFFKTGQLNEKSCQMADDSGGDGTPVVDGINSVSISPAGYSSYDKNEAEISITGYSVGDCTGAEQITRDVLSKLGIGAAAIAEVGCISREGRITLYVTRSENAGDAVTGEPAQAISAEAATPPAPRATSKPAANSTAGSNPPRNCNRNKATGECMKAIER